MSSLKEEETKRILIPKKDHFNIIRYKNHEIFSQPIKNDNTIIVNAIQSIQKNTIYKESLRQIGFHKSRNLSSNIIQDKTQFNSAIEIPTKIDSTAFCIFKNINNHSIKKKINESVFYKGIIKLKNIKLCASNRKLLQSSLIKTREEKAKVIVSKVKNVDAKNKVIISEKEVTINIEITLIVPERKQRNKRQSSLLYNASYCHRNSNQLNYTNQIKYILENVDQSTIDLFSIKKSMDLLMNNNHINNNSNRQRMSIFNSNKSIRNVINNVQYPIYFLPNLGQGLLEEISK